MTALATIQPTAEQILQANGLNGDQLMGLVRTAITDELRRRSITIDSASFEDLHSKILEGAISLACQHDPELGSLSLPTRIYRFGRWRTLDYIRRDRIPEHARRADLEDLDLDGSGAPLEPETFEALVESIRTNLTPRALKTLHEIARPMLVEGRPRWRIASDRNLHPDDVEELLTELGTELRRAA